jgi:hypothetical protein
MQMAARVPLLVLVALTLTLTLIARVAAKGGEGAREESRTAISCIVFSKNRACQLGECE